MAKQLRESDSNSQKEFIKIVLDAAEKQKYGIENKASILIATDSLLLAALGSFINSFVLGNGSIKLTNTIAVYLLATIVIAIGSSIFCSLNVLKDFGGKNRRKLMKLPKEEIAVFWVGKIVDFHDARAYREAVTSLSPDGLIEQLTDHIYNLSRLVMYRYKWFQRALFFLISGLLLFLAYVIVIFFVH